MLFVEDQPGCATCTLRLAHPKANFVPPKLGAGLRLALGMNPAMDEVRHRPIPEPFVGPSGKFLRFAYGKIGVAWNDVTLANVCQCRLPAPKNLFPTDEAAREYLPLPAAKEAIRHCWKTYVIPLLKSKRWERIDLLGAPALEKGTGKRGILPHPGKACWAGTQLSMLDAPELGAVAVATMHPAYLMRTGEYIPLFYNDLRRSLVPAPESYILQGQPADFPKDVSTLSLDLETNTANGPTREIEIRLCGIGTEPYKGGCFSWTDDRFQRWLRVAARQIKDLYGHNIMAFDMPVLEANGIDFRWNLSALVGDEPEMRLWDTMLMHHLLWPTLRHDLGSLGRQYTSQSLWKDWKLTDDPEELYCNRDQGNTHAIGVKLRDELCRDPKLLHLYRFTQLPLARICHYMSQQGITRDPGRIQLLRARTETQMVSVETALPTELKSFEVTKNKNVPAPAGTVSAKTGKPLKVVKQPYQETLRPWASAPQVGRWLYDVRGFEEQTTKEGRRTTGKIAIDRLVHKYSHEPSIPAIRELRRLASRLLYCPTHEDGSPLTEVERLYPSFLPHGTATGRLSSSGPNIQNWEEDVRIIVVPSKPGWVLWKVDFSQIEPRLTAWFSKDTERAARYNQMGFNEHKFVASLFFNIPYNKIEKDDSKDSVYGKAKRINNGANYLLGAKSLAKMYDWDLVNTKRLHEQWKRLMPRCVEWQRKVVAEVTGPRGSKMLYNPFGRRGLFYYPGAAAAAVAFDPQSTAADILHRTSIALLYDRIGWPKWKAQKVARVVRSLPYPATINVQRHDELLGECPKEALADVFGVVKEVAEQAWPELGGLAIPVTREWSSESWGEMVAWAD